MTRQAYRAATTLVVAAFASGCHPAPTPSAAAVAERDGASVSVSVPSEPGESHLSNIRRLTNGGENAEAYFSHDGQWLTFQSTRDGRTCDQQYVMRIDGSGVRRISNGEGKTTCGYFFDGDRRLFFASTHANGAACPPRPDPSQGYVWGLDKFDIYTIDRDGTGLRRLTNNNVYTAEGTLSPDGKTIVFTSLKDGDLDIYTMSVDGSNVRRLTTAPGYDGGPFFSGPIAISCGRRWCGRTRWRYG
jgi:dipeptidyl aminopeptidase/acylaminoacyl peptidase